MTIRTNALHAMLQLEIAAANWFAKMSPKERKVYTGAHPRSKYARNTTGVLTDQARSLAQKSGARGLKHENRADATANNPKKKQLNAAHTKVAAHHENAQNAYASAASHFSKGNDAAGHAALKDGHKHAARAAALGGKITAARHAARAARAGKGNVKPVGSSTRAKQPMKSTKRAVPVAGRKPKVVGGGGHAMLDGKRVPVRGLQELPKSWDKKKVSLKEVIDGKNKSTKAAVPVAGKTPGKSSVNPSDNALTANKLANKHWSHSSFHDEKRGIANGNKQTKLAKHHSVVSDHHTKAAIDFGKAEDAFATKKRDAGHGFMKSGRDHAKRASEAETNKASGMIED
jgi:hypothetical protein